MFDIGFTELMVIGVVALLVVGPERLPKVARTAGHLYGRMQRYVSSVKSDISREVELDELRKVGQGFRESVESAASEFQQEATVVDDYLRKETDNIGKVMAAMAVTEGERPVTEPAMKELAAEQQAQQALPFDDPNLDALEPPAAARPDGPDENASHGASSAGEKSA
ncbi:MAG: Sec-independent protein translocase protein TatB [Thiobacillaceae bacterium]|jgi:sec-independent protein translocase protein TatB|nr:Sec-independent protein translocase protein TatB [Thiobacillaceae bacterium]